MTADDFRRIALSLEGAEEGSHMGAVHFCVGGRICATLASVKLGYGNLMLSPAQQLEFCAEQPEMFLPVAVGGGGWELRIFRLAEADGSMMEGALHAASKRRVGMNGKKTAIKRVRKAKG